MDDSGFVAVEVACIGIVLITTVLIIWGVIAFLNWLESATGSKAVKASKQRTASPRTHSGLHGLMTCPHCGKGVSNLRSDRKCHHCKRVIPEGLYGAEAPRRRPHSAFPSRTREQSPSPQPVRTNRSRGLTCPHCGRVLTFLGISRKCSYCEQIIPKGAGSRAPAKESAARSAEPPPREFTSDKAPSDDRAQPPPDKSVAFKCHDCGQAVRYPEYPPQGTRCPHCSGQLVIQRATPPPHTQPPSAEDKAIAGATLAASALGASGFFGLALAVEIAIFLVFLAPIIAVFLFCSGGC